MKTYTYTANYTAPNTFLRDTEFLATNLVNEINQHLTENEVDNKDCDIMALNACGKVIASILYQTYGYNDSLRFIESIESIIKSKLNHLRDLRFQTI